MKLFDLPPPTTFAEGMRLLFAVAALIGAVAFGIGMIALVAVLVWGGWPSALYGQIIEILGIVAIGGLVLIGISQVGILLGGPVGRFKAAVDKSGASVEASDHESALVPSVTTTTTVTPAPASPDPKP